MFNKSFNKKNDSRKTLVGGFTLIEIIVSLAIFAVVSVVAIGSLLKVIDANKKAQALKTAINNLNFALEAMSREIRTGSEYEEGSVSVTGGTDEITFRTSKDCEDDTALYLSYKYDATAKTLLKSSGCKNSPELSDYDPIVSADLTVTYLEFFVTNVETPDDINTQPMIRMAIQGYSGLREKDRSYFSLQTIVSQRIMPI